MLTPIAIARSGFIASGQVGWPHHSSGAVRSGQVADTAVNSGNVGSGSIGRFHMASGAINSGHLNTTGTPDATKFLDGTFQWATPGAASVGSGDIGSGKIASGAVQGFFGATRHVASGTVGVFDFGSGAVVAGAVGSGAVVSGNVASGSIGTGHLADESVTSGDIASGSVSRFKVASGSLLGFELGSGAVVSGRIASGQVGFGHLADASVQSGTIASGIIGSVHLADESVTSGDLASGSVSRFKVASGSFLGFELGSGAVVSGRVASGQIGFGHLANASVQSGTVASGSLFTYHLASGATATRAQMGGPYFSGTSWTALAGEPISGTRAVVVHPSGGIVRIAMASVSGRMPAIGVVFDNVASGIQCDVYDFGSFSLLASGNFDFSGQVFQPIYVGRSGQIVTASGGFNSGGLAIGDVVQVVGNAWNSGEVTLALQHGVVVAGQNTIVLPGLGGVSVSASGVTSGAVVSGNLGSGSVQGFFGATRHIASGTVGVFDFGSGAIIAGTVGSGAVISGNIASGSVGTGHLADEAVTSGDIASGSISRFKVASGSLLGFELGSGAIVSGRVASGQIGFGHLANAAVQSGTIASGIIGSVHLADASVTSGDVASGTISRFHMASGAINSGHINTAGTPSATTFLDGTFTWATPGAASVGSGDIGSGKIASGAVQGFFGVTRHIVSGTVGVFDFGSGAIIAGSVGSGAVVSGNLASGQVGQFHHASGSVASGHVANNAVVSGGVASGQLFTYHLASGATTTRAQMGGPYFSGTTWTATAGEPISGTRAVVIHPSGGIVRIAMASVSGRMPAVGVVFDNVASGIQCDVYDFGSFALLASGNFDFSGYVFQPIYVGRSGQIVTASGGFNSGGLAIGDTVQVVGKAWNSGEVTLALQHGVIVAGQNTIVLPGLTGVSVSASGLSSGAVQSGHVGSGATQGFFGATRHIASGTVGVFDFGSGAIIAGTVGSGAVVSGNVASGQIGTAHLADEAVTSGDIASGSISRFKIASGSLEGFELGSGAVVSGRIASGQVGFGHLANASVQSGGIASGIIGTVHLADSSVTSGDLASGTVSRFHMASGAINSGHINMGGTPDGTNFFRSDFTWAAAGGGSVGSGDIGSGKIASGAVQGYYGTTRHIASGTVGDYDLASGFKVQYVASFVSGSQYTALTAEAISGVKAVQLTASGNLRIAMASVSGRMPAIGIVFDNVASGIQANVYAMGLFQNPASGIFDFSGYVGQALYVGRSGQIVSTSGSFNSGGLGGSDVVQYMGTAPTSGSLALWAGEAANTQLTLPAFSQGRLTLTSGVAVPTADVSGATTLFFTPFGGNYVRVPNLIGSVFAGWKTVRFNQISQTTPLRSGLNHDVFVWDNAGTLTLQYSSGWTNDSTRRDPLFPIDGVFVNSGVLGNVGTSMPAKGGLWVGTVRPALSGTIHDTGAPSAGDTPKRFTWNAFNRVQRHMRAIEDADSWTYSTAAFRQANNDATNQLEFIQGAVEDSVEANVFALGSSDAIRNNPNGIGLDSATVNSANMYFGTTPTANSIGTNGALYVGAPALGYHFLAWLEFSETGGTTTWYGDAGVSYLQAGINGSVFA